MYGRRRRYVGRNPSPSFARAVANTLDDLIAELLGLRELRLNDLEPLENLRPLRLDRRPLRLDPRAPFSHI